MSTHDAKPDSPEVTRLKEKLKSLEEKDQRIATQFSKEHRAEAQQRNDAMKAEVRAAIKAAK